MPGSDLVAATDAVLPSMVERDPEWAGWCAVLVNLNDLAAMGAEPVGLLDALGARDRSFATRVVHGLAAAARAWDVPVLGGHTQLGVPAALSVTALGRTDRPVPGGGGRPGHAVRLTADLGGRWRAGYTGQQWDSTSGRTTAELRAMGSAVARTAPAAAKDVSMAGVVGTLGMLAEASGCGATLDVADVPRPAGVTRRGLADLLPRLRDAHRRRPGRRAGPRRPGHVRGLRHPARHPRGLPALARRPAHRGPLPPRHRTRTRMSPSPSTSTTVITAVSAAFGRDLEEAYAAIATIAIEARERGTDLLVLPEACLGGYLPSLGNAGDDAETRARRARDLPPALELDGPELRRVAGLAGDMLVLVGIREAAGADTYNTAVALTGDGVLATHRKVHQPLGENLCYAASDGFAAFDSPVGRMGMLDLLRQGLPRGLPHPRPRRRRDHRRAVGLAGGPDGDGGQPGGRPLEEAPRPLRRRPGAGQPGGLGGLQPGRHLRLAAVRRQRQGGRAGR